MSIKLNIRTILGAGFLLLQVISVLYAQYIPERFFCWRPYDNHTLYKIQVLIDDQPLEAREVEKRYRYPSQGWERRSIHNIFSIVEQYEHTYGQNDNAIVFITYAENGKPETKWKLHN